MSMNGIRVLVDGYNLELAQGTGIKSYGLSLLGALRALKIEAGVLYSRPAKSDPEFPALTEVAFFDAAWRASRRDRLKLIMALARGVAGLPLPATAVPLRFVVRPELPESAEVLTRLDCFRLSFAVNRLTSRLLEIKTPSPFDIWHATCPIPIRVRGAKSVVTIHDLVPFRLPYTTLDRKHDQFRHYRAMIENADVVVAVSEATKADILLMFDVQPDKIAVTYQPVVAPGSEPQDDARVDGVLARFGLKPKEYLLFVGAIEPKKNVKTLIEAFLEIDTHMPLVVLGRKGWLWEEQLRALQTPADPRSAARIASRVRQLDHVGRNELRSLYAGALCFVFPSLYEGFGLPPVEAMAFDVPVITSNVASLPEVCGNAALYVDPYSAMELRCAIERMISDEELRRRCIEAGRQRVAFFSMANYTTRLMQAYQRAL
jgi:glycosyltransferase involved in cell wall biosynthesis